jgi:hypothetical protein
MSALGIKVLIWRILDVYRGSADFCDSLQSKLGESPYEGKTERGKEDDGDSYFSGICSVFSHNTGVPARWRS